jgi:pilus assembly protein CpaE
MTVDPLQRSAAKTQGPRDVFLSFVRDDSANAMLQKFSADKGLQASRQISGNIKDAITYLKENRTPVVLLTQIDSRESVTSDLNALADVCEADVKVILCGQVNELDFYFKLVEMGVTEYILLPLKAEDLEKAFSKCMAKNEGDAANQPAKKIGVIGTRGGVGATCIAENLALVISSAYELNTVLVDSDFQGGTISLDFDLQPSRGVKEALEKPDRIDSLFMDRVLIRYEKTLSLLSSEEGFESEIKVHEKALDVLMGEMESKFGVMIFDFSHTISKTSVELMRRMDELILVSELSVSGLRDSLRFNELFTAHLHKTNVTMVLNRIGLAKKHEMPISNFEKSLKRDVNHKIPFEADIFGYENMGKPLAEVAKNSKLYRAVEGMASNLLGVGAPGAAGSSKGGIFSSILGKSTSSNSKKGVVAKDVREKKPR